MSHPFETDSIQERKKSYITNYAKKIREFSLDLIEMSLYMDENPDNMTFAELEDNYLSFLQAELEFYRKIVNIKIYKNSKKMKEKAKNLVKFQVD